MGIPISAGPIGGNYVKTTKPFVLGLLSIAAFVLAGCSHHNLHDTRGAKVGILTCESVPESEFSLLIHSNVKVKCSIEHAGIKDKYKGDMGVAFGIDLKWKREQTLRWAVVSATGAKAGRGFLAGRFVGAKASATLGYGGGVKVLSGGGKNHITLQPLAVSNSKGLGLAAGMAYLNLKRSK